MSIVAELGFMLHPELETLPRPRLAALQFERLRQTLERATAVPLYRQRFAEAGVGPATSRVSTMPLWRAGPAKPLEPIAPSR